MISFQRHTPRWLVIVLDLGVNFAALIFAYLIRFDLKADYAVIEHELNTLSKSIGFYFLVKYIVFYLFKIHKGLIRHTSTEDLRRIFLAVFTCTLIFVVASFFRFHFVDDLYLFPMSIIILEFLASFAFVVGSRFIVKLIYLEATKDKTEKFNVLIYGAGVSGLITKRTIEKDRYINQRIIGFLDDNKKLHNTRLEGTRIYSTDKLQELVDRSDTKSR